jgi:signal transduction histidine kinase
MSARLGQPLLAAALTALCLLELALSPDATDAPLAPVVIVLLGISAAVARTWAPAATVAAAALTLTALSFSGDFPDASPGFLAILAYSCAARAEPAAAAGATALLTGAVLVTGGAPVPVVAAAIVPWSIGRQVRRRNALVAELAARNRELEAEEDAFARLAVRRERARIARELHDIIGHHLAVIVVQAGAGRMAAGDDPHTAERLAGIRESANEALAEMARLVDLLEADVPDRRLALLLERARDIGLEVDITGDVALPTELDEIVYRVVQESLTNALKHAPGAAVHVRLELDDRGLSIEVANGPSPNGGPLARAGAGLGLSGMSERLAAHGGELAAGPVAGGGWVVTARVPDAHPVAVTAAAAPPVG